MVQRFGTRLMKIHRDVFLEISRPLLLPLSVKKESLFLKSKGRPWLPRFLRLLCSRDFSIELRCLAQFFLFFFLFKYIFIFMILDNSSNYQACFVIFDFRVIFNLFSQWWLLLFYFHEFRAFVEFLASWFVFCQLWITIIFIFIFQKLIQSLHVKIAMENFVAPFKNNY